MRKQLFFILMFVVNVSGQNVSTGLKFTDPEKLQGIPLASTPFSGAELPEFVDLSSNMPPAGNQGNQSSCVAWAVAYATKSYQEKVEENFNYTTGGSLNHNAVFSPAYIYNQINNGVDGGSYISDALNVLSQKGAVKWSDMPYSQSDYRTKPDAGHDLKAKRYRIDFWRRVNINDTKEIKAQLNAGYPVVIGATVDRGFQDGGWASGGRDFVWNSVNGEQLGGHAMTVVGYSNSKGAFKVLNSWSDKWGNAGYCWISYPFFSQVVKEGYVMKDALNAPENSPRPNPVVTPTSDLPSDFKITNVQHNFSDMYLGQVMRFSGSVHLPAGIGNTTQVVIKFYLNDGRNGKGLPIGSLSTNFMMPDGTAVCGTPIVPVATGSGPWFASMPYQYLNVPRGGYVYGVYQLRTTYLIAEPILYVDGFAINVGELIPFFVNL